MFFVGYTEYGKKSDEHLFEYVCGVDSEVVEASKKGFYRLNLKDKSGNILSHYEMPERDFFTLTLERRL